MYDIFEHLLQSYGITAYKFCKETGISQSTISTWKKKKNIISGEIAQTIANYFNVSVDYFKNEETAQVAQEIFENKELRALFDVQRGMSAEDLQALHGMALALKRKERGGNDDTGC